MEELPISSAQADFVTASRRAIQRIIFTDERRFLLIVGPCSIHDREAGLDYARRLANLSRQVSDRVMIVMRVYFEKPRTTVGWKGLIMDPHLDGSSDIAAGLRLGRAFMREVLDLGLPTATEFLDPIMPQYIADLVCWGAIGARTTESQIHRQLASGLSMPVGFKNGIDGGLKSAVNAIQAAAQSHTFLSIRRDGVPAAVRTRGNRDCHVVLRGGANGPNYSAQHVTVTEQLLANAGLPLSILVDASHDNSSKKPELQPAVVRDLIAQIQAGNRSLMGAMVESNLGAGSQAFPQPKETLRYGVSITDPCIDWTDTERLAHELHAGLAPRFA